MSAAFNSNQPSGTTDILLIRHGETDWNVERRIQGYRDIALNAHGRQQAQRLAQALQHEQIDAVYCSDLQRARETAEPFAARLGLTIQFDPMLRERCFGAFEGLVHSDIAATYPDHLVSWQQRDIDARYPDGPHRAETLREFMDRSVTAVTRLATSAASAPRRIAIVTHGGVLECLHRAATGTSIAIPRDFEIYNAGINRLRWQDGKLQLLQWGDIAHLDASLDETVR